MHDGVVPVPGAWMIDTLRTAGRVKWLAIPSHHLKRPHHLSVAERRG